MVLQELIDPDEFSHLVDMHLGGGGWPRMADAVAMPANVRALWQPSWAAFVHFLLNESHSIISDTRLPLKNLQQNLHSLPVPFRRPFLDALSPLSSALPGSTLIRRRAP